MAYDGLTPDDPLLLPRSIRGLTEADPLPPPGHQTTAEQELHPHKSGHYPAVVHQVTAQLGGAITNSQVWTATITPVSTPQGPATASTLVPVVLTVTVGTATAAALGADFVTAATNASTLSALASVDTTTRLGEIATVTDNGTGLLTFDAVSAGLVFEVLFAPEAGGTAPAVITPGSDADNPDIRIGIFVARTGAVSPVDGRTPIIRLLQSGDTASDIYGVVATGSRVQPIDPAQGYTFVTYKDGRDVPIIPLDGTHTVFTDAAVTHADELWVRVVATGAEVAGASAGAPGSLVYTTTPTAQDTTQYIGFVQVYDSDGNTVATSQFDFTSDGSATATEVVTGITADLTGSSVDSFLTLGGTSTLTLTMDAGFTADVVGNAALLSTVAAPTAPTHVKLQANFTRTRAAGIGEITYDL